MIKSKRDMLDAFIILAVTVVILYILPLTGLLRDAQPDDLVGFRPIILLFLFFNLVLIGVPAWFHWKYSRNYGKIRSVWFFTLFGGIIGALLGEIALGASIILILPYTILMFLYAQLYKRFTWWKVALTTYFGGIFVENIINRSPIQIPTLMWIAFFTCPYFVTKMWENKKHMHLKDIFEDFKWVLLSSVILVLLAIYVGLNSDRMSPPLIFFGAVLPFIVAIIYKSIRK